MAPMPQRMYTPAAGRDVFLRFYDPLTRLFGGRKILLALLEQAALHPGLNVLDVGCGTGTVVVLTKQVHPTIELIGLDPDPKALAIATAKAARAGVAVRFDRGFADQLPYEDGSFDRVFSSLMFHHLRRDDRPKVLAEIHRVLKPGGSLEFVDIAGGGHGFLLRLLHGRPAAQPPGEDRMLARFREAGFADARKVADRQTGFGPIAYYQARR